MKPACLLRLADGLLGTEPRQRLRASQSALALLVYLAFALVQHAEVRMGLMDAADSWRLTAWNLGGATVFFLLIRSGLNLRLAPERDRALTMPQSLWAMVGICWSYAITGPARGAVILILLLVLIFGSFSLKPREARVLAATGFVLLAGVMVFKALTDPARYDPRIEGLHLLFAGIVMAAVSALAIRMARLRARLEQQRSELAAALQRIQRLATHDELTGLTNRRAATERMREELALHARLPAAVQPLLSVVLIDIDHFKRVNDELGHAAGDEVLRRFAAAGQSVLRTGELLARWGGEEFLLLMPAASGEQAAAAALRLREQLRRQCFDDLQPGLAVNFSAGVAECRRGDELDAAIARADAALYEAKRAGRDRVQLERRAAAATGSATPA
jgi:diguanylate cyclase (GGDEF)-like protein